MTYEADALGYWYDKNARPWWLVVWENCKEGRIFSKVVEDEYLPNGIEVFVIHPTTWYGMKQREMSANGREFMGPRFDVVVLARPEWWAVEILIPPSTCPVRMEDVGTFDDLKDDDLIDIHRVEITRMEVQ